jgi:hypothetical protein
MPPSNRSSSQPPPPAPPRGITLLGGPSTGKTTFLAALQIALLRDKDLDWVLEGNNQASTQAMVRFMDEMTHEHMFPRATVAQMENYKWSLTGDKRQVWVWDRWWFRRRARTTKIRLDLVDGPGGAAKASNIMSAGLGTQLLASMADSGGLIIFFDPLTEMEHGHSFQHLYGALTVLLSQVGSDGKLPHHVAVCITKFDSIPVFRSARALRMIQRAPEGQRFPHIPERYAEQFLERLISLSRSDDASLILPMLKRTFHEDRIRFFVTSAIGFYVDSPGGMFDSDDYQNHIPSKPRDRIRGGIYPINVVEPVLWLGKLVAKAGS